MGCLTQQQPLVQGHSRASQGCRPMQQELCAPQRSLTACPARPACMHAPRHAPTQKSFSARKGSSRSPLTERTTASRTRSLEVTETGELGLQPLPDSALWNACTGAAATGQSALR